MFISVKAFRMRKMWLLQSLAKLSVFLDEWFECLSHYIGGDDADLKLPRMQTVVF
jgi:hypothetical protein